MSSYNSYKRFFRLDLAYQKQIPCVKCSRKIFQNQVEIQTLTIFRSGKLNESVLCLKPSLIAALDTLGDIVLCSKRVVLEQ